jgi:hypothetical protein
MKFKNVNAASALGRLRVAGVFERSAHVANCQHQADCQNSARYQNAKHGSPYGEFVREDAAFLSCRGRDDGY